MVLTSISKIPFDISGIDTGLYKLWPGIDETLSDMVIFVSRYFLRDYTCVSFNTHRANAP